MKTLSVYGSSDDLIEIEGEGIPGVDEYTARSGKIAGKFNLTAGTDGLRITAIYDGCWSFAIGQTDEPYPIPNWPMRISTHKNEYSVLLEIDVPDDARLERVDKKSGGRLESNHD